MEKELFRCLFGIRKEQLPGNIILTPFFSPKRFETYCENIAPFKGKLYSGAICRSRGKDLGMIRCGIGAGIAGDCVMGLGKSPVSNIVFIGSAGGLNDAKIGNIIVADSACDGEGFSRYHNDGMSFKDIIQRADLIASDPVLSKKIEQKLNEKVDDANIIRTGKIFTIGSLTAETEENLKELESEGFSAVEMELSAVLSAANKIGKSLSGVLFISDEPLVKPLWKELEKEDKNNYNNSVDAIIKNVIDLFTKK